MMNHYDPDREEWFTVDEINTTRLRNAEIAMLKAEIERLHKALATALVELDGAKEAARVEAFEAAAVLADWWCSRAADAIRLQHRPSATERPPTAPTTPSQVSVGAEQDKALERALADVMPAGKWPLGTYAVFPPSPVDPRSKPLAAAYSPDWHPGDISSGHKE